MCPLIQPPIKKPCIPATLLTLCAFVVFCASITSGWVACLDATLVTRDVLCVTDAVRKGYETVPVAQPAPTAAAAPPSSRELETLRKDVNARLEKIETTKNNTPTNTHTATEPDSTVVTQLKASVKTLRTLLGKRAHAL